MSERQKNRFDEFDWDLFDSDLAKSHALQFAQDLLWAIGTCELQATLKTLIRGAIHREGSEIAEETDLDLERLNKLRRIKRRFTAFIAASESLIEDVEFITGQSAKEFRQQQRSPAYWQRAGVGCTNARKQHRAAEGEV